MCGISGYLDFDNGVDKHILHQMTDIINYRGPDDEGYALFSEEETLYARGQDTVGHIDMPMVEGNDFRAFLGFGHRRLSIIDLSAAGHQPMSYDHGRLTITYNGEIYNYIELRQGLESKGYTFKTSSDTEVILVAYDAWGESCAEHFNGMWSFAIFDRRAQKIFCSRDRLGAKPFNYYLEGNHFVFGSEIKQLCLDPMMPHYVDEKRLATTLLLGIQDYDESTLVESVKTLSGGWNLVIELDLAAHKVGNIRKYQYWDLCIPEQKSKDSGWYEAIHDSVRLRLRSDAPLGIMISGGVDSTFLANEITHNINSCAGEGDRTRQHNSQGDGISSFTSCYRDDAADDETYYAHQVNEACGLNEHLIYPDRQDTFEAYRDMLWHHEDIAPFGTLGSFMTLEQVAKTGVKVIINGQGGDESMFGYERYYAYYLRDLLRSNPLSGINTFRQMVANSRLTAPQLLAMLAYFNYPKIRFQRNKRRVNNLLHTSLVEQCNFHDVSRFIAANNLDDLIYKELRFTQLTHILRMDDRAYMAFSMESRVPFIDYRYLEAAVSIDPHIKIQSGYTKYLLRKKMSGQIPNEVVWRKKKNGWSSPAKRWTSRFEQEKVEDLFRVPRAESYFNTQAARRMWAVNPVNRDVNNFFAVELLMCGLDLRAK